MKLNFRQLEAFHAVMKTGSASQAAAMLDISQPGVSALIMKLEQHLSLELFERRKGRLLPTFEAQYLSQEVNVLFEDMQNIHHALSDIKNLTHWHLRIACYPCASLLIVPTIIAHFLEQHQDVKVSIQTLYAQEVTEWVEHNQHHIGLAERQAEQAGVDVDPIDLDCVVAIPKAHPLAKKPEITVQDLDQQTLITLQARHGTNQALRQALTEANCHVNVRCETQISTAALAMVQHGLGIALVEPLAAYTHAKQYQTNNKIVFRPFKPTIKFKLGILYKKGSTISQATKQFSDLLKKEVMRLNDLSLYQA